MDVRGEGEREDDTEGDRELGGDLDEEREIGGVGEGNLLMVFIGAVGEGEAEQDTVGDSVMVEEGEGDEERLRVELPPVAVMEVEKVGRNVRVPRGPTLRVVVVVCE